MSIQSLLRSLTKQGIITWEFQVGGGAFYYYHLPDKLPALTKRRPAASMVAHIAKNPGDTLREYVTPIDDLDYSVYTRWATKLLKLRIFNREFVGKDGQKRVYRYTLNPKLYAYNQAIHKNDV